MELQQFLFLPRHKARFVSPWRYIRRCPLSCHTWGFSGSHSRTCRRKISWVYRLPQLDHDDSTRQLNIHCSQNSASDLLHTPPADDQKRWLYVQCHDFPSWLRRLPARAPVGDYKHVCFPARVCWPGGKANRHTYAYNPRVPMINNREFWDLTNCHLLTIMSKNLHAEV